MNVEIEQFEEEENGLYRIYIAVLVDKDSQKAILIGKGGEKLKKSLPKPASIWKNCLIPKCF